MLLPVLHAFIDESGQRSKKLTASPHFVLGGVIVRDRNLPVLADALSSMRAAIKRQSGHELHWSQIRSHSDRLHIAQRIGSSSWLRAIAVVGCKRHLPPAELNDDQVYLFQFRFLLERLSWLAREHGEVATYTLAHVKGFKMETLREYERRLRTRTTEIAWEHLTSGGGEIDQPGRDERLQLADLFTSATASAFNPDPHGNTEQRYLREMRRALYAPAGKALTSYGIKMHPWKETTKAAYPWVATL